MGKDKKEEKRRDWALECSLGEEGQSDDDEEACLRVGKEKSGVWHNGIKDRMHSKKGMINCAW